MENKRQKTELADIFSENASCYLKAVKLRPVQRKAYKALLNAEVHHWEDISIAVIIVDIRSRLIIHAETGTAQNASS